MAKGSSPRSRYSGQADEFGQATDSDVRGMKRRAKAKDSDSPHKAAYEAGKSGSGNRAAYDGDPEMQELYDSGVADRKSEQEEAGGGPADIPAKNPSVVGAVAAAPGLEDGAGFLLGVVVYTLVLNFIRGGMPAVRGWMAAKFLNKPYTGTVEQLTPTIPTQLPVDYLTRFGRPQ